MATEVDVKAPWWTVIGPEEGESIWQPEPTQGYVTVNLTPDNMPLRFVLVRYSGVAPRAAMFANMGIGRIMNCCSYTKGPAAPEIEDETYEIVPGSTIMFGRYARQFC